MTNFEKLKKEYESNQQTILACKLKLHNEIKEYLKTEEFEKQLLRVARDNPYEFIRFAFCKLIDEKAVLAETYSGIDFYLDYKKIEEIIPNYYKAIILIENDYDSMVSINGDCISEAFMYSIRINKNTIIDLVTCDLEHEDYDAKWAYNITPYGRTIKEICIELIKKNGIEHFFENQEMNHLLINMYSNNLLNRNRKSGIDFDKLFNKLGFSRGKHYFIEDMNLEPMLVFSKLSEAINAEVDICQ